MALSQTTESCCEYVVGQTSTRMWVSLQDKYQQRVHVPNVTSLRIENLTSEDSGHYQARATFTGGLELTQVLHLTVYGE